MSLASIIALLCILFVFTFAWYGLSVLLTPNMADPDGIARVTGNCGDTMELGFKVKDNKVVETHHWTDGCTTSRNCIESAARLAHGKSISELEKINMHDIATDIGHIPDSHLHCAQLAETTLQQARDTYLKRQIPEKN